MVRGILVLHLKIYGILTMDPGFTCRAPFALNRISLPPTGQELN